MVTVTTIELGLAAPRAGRYASLVAEEFDGFPDPPGHIFGSALLLERRLVRGTEPAGVWTLCESERTRTLLHPGSHGRGTTPSGDRICCRSEVAQGCNRARSPGGLRPSPSQSRGARVCGPGSHYGKHRNRDLAPPGGCHDG